MAFWTSENKLPIGQESVSIPAENELDYRPGQKVIIRINKEVGFFQPKQSFLKCKLTINPTIHSTTVAGTATFKTLVQLNPEIGGQVLIKDIRILSGTGVLLEEIQGYNTLVNVMYSYDSNDNEKAKRALTQGTTTTPAALQSTLPIQSWKNPDRNNVITNPAFTLDGAGGRTLNDIHMCLPLHTGILNSEKVFPVMLTEGLRIEILLEEAGKCLVPISRGLHGSKRTDGTVTQNADTEYLLDNCQMQCAAWDSLTAPNDPAAPVDPGGAITAAGQASPSLIWASGESSIAPVGNVNAGHQEFFLARRAGVVSVRTCPLIVGNAIRLSYVKNNNDVIPNNVSVAWPQSDQVPGPFLVIKALTDVVSPTNDLTYVRVTVRNPEAVNATYLPPAVTDLLQPTFVRNVSGLYFGGYGVRHQPTYTLSNVELVLGKIMPPPAYVQSMVRAMKERGVISYDFLTYQNYRVSSLKTDRQNTMLLPLNNSRAKSILCVPTNAEKPLDIDFWSSAGRKPYYFDGIINQLTRYQFVYGGKLNPDRPVDVAKLNSKPSAGFANTECVEQQPLIELEKALVMAGIRPLSFSKYNTNFLIGRCLALNNNVFDTRNRDFQLNLSYEEATEPEFNMLWNNYVAHVRGLRFTSAGIQVIY